MPANVTGPWWLAPLPQELAAGGKAPGLASSEARERLASFGVSLFRQRQRKSMNRNDVSRFLYPLTATLLLTPLGGL